MRKADFRSAIRAFVEILRPRRRADTAKVSSLSTAARRFAVPLAQIKRQMVATIRRSFSPEIGDAGSARGADLLHVLRLEREETLHTRILGWLVDPEKSGQFGRRLLVEILVAIPGTHRAVLKKIVRKTSRVIVESGGERGRPDIEVRAASFLLLIENKLDSPQRASQLIRYRKRAASTARLLGTIPVRNRFLIYLTLDPEDGPSASTGFHHLTYAELSACLERTLHASRDAARGVTELAEQYLATIRKLCLEHEGLSAAVQKIRIEPHAAIFVPLEILKRVHEWKGQE